MVQVVECLPGKCKALSSNPSTGKRERKGRKENSRGGREGTSQKGARTGQDAQLEEAQVDLPVWGLSLS
jgi:ribosomal protein L4